MFLKNISFKKLVILSAIGYIAFGVFVLYQYFGEEDKKAKTSQPVTIKEDGTYYWYVNDESKGNYKAPAWLRDNSLFKYTPEVHYSDVPEFKPSKVVEYQLMSFFAYLQLADPTLTSSFINPELAYKDYDVRRPNEMKEQAKVYSDTITKNQTIERIELKLLKDTTDKKIYEVSLYYKNGTESIFQIPMINLEMQNESDYSEYDEDYTEDETGTDDDHEHDVHEHDIDEMWFLNVGLSTIEQYIQK